MFAVFLKIGFPVIAILIGICLILMVVFSVKYENKLSSNSYCAARLSIYATLIILTILFLVLFVIGILTRRTVVMAVGIPILCLIFLTIVWIICRRLKNRGEETTVIRRSPLAEKNVTDTELQNLKSKNNASTELPTYDDVMNP